MTTIQHPASVTISSEKIAQFGPRGNYRQPGGRPYGTGPRPQRSEFGPEIDRQDRYGGGQGQAYGRSQNREFRRREASARDYDDGYHVAEEGRHSGGFGNQTGFYNDRDHDDMYDAGAYGSNERGWLERTGDEVASWFGDDEAAQRRDMDHRGRGPKGYQRSDDKIREDVSERMFHDPRLDASNIELSVKDGEVTLDGTVDSKRAKRWAEDLVDSVAGIGHVQNNLRANAEGAKTRTGTTS